jgi:hypothetical protein
LAKRSIARKELSPVISGRFKTPSNQRVNPNQSR